MTHDTDSTARVVVDKSYHWKPIDENTPRGPFAPSVVWAIR